MKIHLQVVKNRLYYVACDVTIAMENVTLLRQLLCVCWSLLSSCSLQGLNSLLTVATCPVMFRLLAWQLAAFHARSCTCCGLNLSLV